MKPKQFNSYPYIAGSLALIIVAVVFSGFLNRQQASQSSADIRARASAPGMVKVTGVVSEVNEVEGIIIVDDVRFEDSTKSLGTWSVTPPSGFSLTSAFSGAKLIITVNPPTMLAESKTLSALEIKVSR
ncbi:hypothetical protein A3A79_00890 [Candidatus Gottesmanbacteria bacterium RIFCSPLOWO2_01_FULL_43_11b]|uniref:Uncharacterized protein n=1 Tax=Candidatus Gottesmanbacteria bacterium RIFCSPLOWO2_01_FULL_43_11b TaxID=1798392 RepID=A0A1F6AG73_9BACT|nr:MAG: hypothetical protein A3A79_00890 [Candidatus Gottesmanbacteria bacterium RIFCSPLOWO2_01_FULL_43_11b]